jgi:L-fuculose-phosphate aldolase
VSGRKISIRFAGLASRELAMTHEEIKQKLIDAGKILEMEGQADFTRGHISVRLPDDPSLFFMKPHSVGFEEITMDNILTIDLEGKVVAGTARRHSEVFIHSEIFRIRPDAQSIIHSHPPYAVALSASGRPMRGLSQPSSLFYEALPVFTETIDLIRTSAMGRGVAEALGPHRAVLLKNHGVVTAGSTIDECVGVALMLETAAMIQMIAEAAGPIAPEFPREQILALQYNLTRPDQFEVNFEYLRRKAARRR